MAPSIRSFSSSKARVRRRMALNASIAARTSEGPRGGTGSASAPPSKRSAAAVRSRSGEAILRVVQIAAAKTRKNRKEVATIS